MEQRKNERNWILYDMGNSAYILMAVTVIPILFNSLANDAGVTEEDALAYWGYAVTISTMITALSGPFLGAVSDTKFGKKKLFLFFVFLGVFSCLLQPWLSGYIFFLFLYVLGKTGFNGSLIFYDSMLNDITTEERMDSVSSRGYAWGYIASCIPFVFCILLLTKKEWFGLDTSTAMKLSFFLIACWWTLFTIPLAVSYRQTTYTESLKSGKDIFLQLYKTILEIREHPKVFWFLVSFFFYIDGVYTIMNMATAYGSSLGLSGNAMILALLLTQIVAFPCALFFGYLSKTIKTELLVKICIVAYALITLYGVGLDKLFEFWVLAVGVGMFQGSIQALSRSYYAKIIPSEKSGEYFGIYDIFGKGASVIGTLVTSLVTQVTGNQHYAIFSLLFLFLAGYAAFIKAEKVD